jgi:hypothetical protein
VWDCELQLLRPNRQLRHVLDIAYLQAVLAVVNERR